MNQRVKSEPIPNRFKSDSFFSLGECVGGACVVRHTTDGCSGADAGGDDDDVEPNRFPGSVVRRQDGGHGAPSIRASTGAPEEDEADL